MMIGIDLGTTNSLVSYWDGAESRMMTSHKSAARYFSWDFKL